MSKVTNFSDSQAKRLALGVPQAAVVCGAACGAVCVAGCAATGSVGTVGVTAVTTIAATTKAGWEIESGWLADWE